MTEIRMDKVDIERIVAQVLRDEYKLLPTTANEAAENIGRRLHSSLISPQAPALNGAKITSPVWYPS